MNQTTKIEKFNSWMFLSTGIFAIIGALYTWGEGPLYLQDDLLTALVPWADLLITGPLSILAAYGIFTRKIWGHITGLMVCGIYLFGSALVYISLAWNGAPYPLELALPPLVGIGFGIWYPTWYLRRGYNSLLTTKSRSATRPAQGEIRKLYPGFLQLNDPSLE